MLETSVMLFLERGRDGERERNIYVPEIPRFIASDAPLTALSRGPGLKPGRVP